MSGKTDQWTVSGPDAFGDFTLASEGEELAKCVVVQNGFRPPDETKEIAAFVHRAVNSHDALVKALETFLEEYCRLVNSGDAGFWDPEKEPKVIAARAAISLAKGGER